MFTGIVQELGTVRTIDQQGDSAVLTIAAHEVLRDVAHGASIAVNGVCLTVTDFSDHAFSVDVMAQTFALTGLGKLENGSRVNLERAMRADGRFDGHIVQGHVDGTAQILAIEPDEHWTKISLRIPAHLERYVVAQGSITLDGVSLTVASIDADRVTVSLIPTTLELTNLSHHRIGDPVNVEVDVLAKYAERLLQPKEPA
ncbi:riboflavin synthase [Calidifontibacter terrae]